MIQDEKPMTAQQKEKILKLIKISSIATPAIILIISFLILPNFLNKNQSSLSWIQFVLVASSVLEIFALRLLAKIIEKKPVVS
jgi:hypothetical protein